MKSPDFMTLLNYVFSNHLYVKTSFLIRVFQFVVVVRNICQADFMSMDPIADDKPFYLARILGVEKNSNDSFYNLVLLLAVFFHR